MNFLSHFLLSLLLIAPFGALCSADAAREDCALASAAAVGSSTNGCCPIAAVQNCRQAASSEQAALGFEGKQREIGESMVTSPASVVAPSGDYDLSGGRIAPSASPAASLQARHVRLQI